MKTEQVVLKSSYEPTGPQQAFRRSSATVRGYGGAMGGGKTRALCEECWDLCLEHPGLKAVPGVKVGLRVSVGSAVFPAEGASFDQLLAMADNRMFRSKAKRAATPAATR